MSPGDNADTIAAYTSACAFFGERLATVTDLDWGVTDAALGDVVQEEDDGVAPPSEVGLEEGVVQAIAGEAFEVPGQDAVWGIGRAPFSAGGQLPAEEALRIGETTLNPFHGVNLPPAPRTQDAAALQSPRPYLSSEPRASAFGF